MTVLGVDIGTVRVGLAASVGTMAMPGGVVDVADVPDGPQWARAVAERIDRAARERGADVIVLGLPKAMSGRDTAAAQRVRRVATALGDYGHRVELIDERLTSVQAERSLGRVGRSGRRSSGAVDQVAASIVLQHWLDVTVVPQDSQRPGGEGRGRG